MSGTCTWSRAEPMRCRSRRCLSVWRSQLSSVTTVGRVWNGSDRPVHLPFLPLLAAEIEKWLCSTLFMVSPSPLSIARWVCNLTWTKSRRVLPWMPLSIPASHASRDCPRWKVKVVIMCVLFMVLSRKEMLCLAAHLWTLTKLLPDQNLPPVRSLLSDDFCSWITHCFVLSFSFSDTSGHFWSLIFCHM